MKIEYYDGDTLVGNTSDITMEEFAEQHNLIIKIEKKYSDKIDECGFRIFHYEASIPGWKICEEHYNQGMFLVSDAMGVEYTVPKAILDLADNINKKFLVENDDVTNRINVPMLSLYLRDEYDNHIYSN